MKKILFSLITIILILTSCDPLAEINEEMDEMDTGYNSSIEYVLIEDDYSTIGTLAISIDPDDAAFITDNKYFNDDVPAADYIPAFLEETFPALSLGSSVLVTYNWNDELPEDLAPYTTTDAYNLEDSDYESIDGVLQATQYYSPGYAPEVYIPEVLADYIASPSIGDLILVTYDYSSVDPMVDFASIADEVIWQETFSGSLGTFTAFNLLGDQDWYASSYGDDEYAKMSGYSGGAVDNEDWLISGGIDLTGISDASLNFRMAANYVDDVWDNLAVLVSTDWDGTEGGIATATWTTLDGYTFPSGSDWVFVESGKIDFSAYADETIYIAFKYVSTSDPSVAATWEIDRVELLVPGDQPPVIGLTPSTVKTFFEFESSGWQKAENIYYLNAADYDAMGAPGKYDNFSSSAMPADYLPALLQTKYPLAGQDFEVVIVYKYYAGTTMILADKYSFDQGEWVSTYNYVQPLTSQFLYSTTGWVFDPTVIFTMESADYQLIVDWVEDNIGADKIDAYGTQEFYTGAGSYYSNFDLRTGKWDSTVFSTWQDAVKYAIGTILLPSKYPDAVAQVSGIDVYYIVTFATYDGSSGTYDIKFQCTKSGPDPEFTYIEGPY